MKRRLQFRFSLGKRNFPPHDSRAAMLEPYSAHWPVEFDSLRAVYQDALGPLILRIEHVGSTSVPGLMAKPILDIDIVISGYDLFPQVVAGLERLGYLHHGDQGIREREAFKSRDAFAPHVFPQRSWMTHHLYVCPQGSRELRRHIAFRDALRADARLCETYAQMKIDIARQAGNDRKIYARLKEEACRVFVETIVSSS